MVKEEFTKYERARILGARGLQVSMDAPVLIKISEEDLEKINYDPLRIAELELESGVLPISVKRPLPEKKEEKLEKIKIEEKVEDDKKKIITEKEDEKIVEEQGEIMELANPEEEKEDLEEESGSNEEVE